MNLVCATRLPQFFTTLECRVHCTNLECICKKIIPYYHSMDTDSTEHLCKIAKSSWLTNHKLMIIFFLFLSISSSFSLSCFFVVYYITYIVAPVYLLYRHGLCIIHRDCNYFWSGKHRHLSSWHDIH